MLSDETIERLWREINQGKGMFLGFNTFARAIEAAVLAELDQEPLMWSFTGSTRLMGEREARLEAKRCGGTTKAFPLYHAPVVQPDMVMVPRKPTIAMLSALTEEWHPSRHENAKKDYAAMIAAAEKEQK